MVKFPFWINFTFLPSPLKVLSATVKFFSGDPMVHIQASIMRVLLGYFIATVLGVSLGILIGWFQKLEDLVFLPLELLRPIPAVAGIPLAILMFPDAESGMIDITFIRAFFPILISTIKGVALICCCYGSGNALEQSSGMSSRILLCRELCPVLRVGW